MISEYLGIDADYVILALAVLILFTYILLIMNLVQSNKLKKKYRTFMGGKDAKTLEEILVKTLIQVAEQQEEINKIKDDIEDLMNHITYTYQKVGVVKYDAFHEMGGKLSFSLALLNEKEDGFIINAMHSREGCYTYIKEIVGGNSIILLSDEEQEALEMAKQDEIKKPKKKRAKTKSK